MRENHFRVRAAHDLEVPPLVIPFISKSAIDRYCSPRCKIGPRIDAWMGCSKTLSRAVARPWRRGRHELEADDIAALDPRHDRSTNGAIIDAVRVEAEEIRLVGEAPDGAHLLARRAPEELDRIAQPELAMRPRVDHGRALHHGHEDGFNLSQR